MTLVNLLRTENIWNYLAQIAFYNDAQTTTTIMKITELTSPPPPPPSIYLLVHWISNYFGRTFFVNKKYKKAAVPVWNEIVKEWNPFQDIGKQIHTFLYKQRFYSTQRQCCLTFSWTELQILLSCCLIHVSSSILRLVLHVLYLDLGLFMS